MDDFKEILCPIIPENKLNEFSPLMLAFIGDAVHTLIVRDDFVKNNNASVNKQHLLCSSKCKASAQSKQLDKITEILSVEEKEIIRRGRNAKSHSMAKNSSIEDYKKATAFETLIGHLYLCGNYKRIKELIKD